MRSKIFIAGLALLALLPGVAQANNGFRAIGYGVKSQGMGGVGIALPQDAFAVAANPAGMARICDRFDIGVYWTHQNARSELVPVNANFSPPAGTIKSRDDYFYPELAINKRIPCDQTIGLAIYAFGGFETDYLDPCPALGSTKCGMEYRQYFVTPSWSWQMNECQSVGIAVNIAFAWTEVLGLETLDNNAASIAPGYVANNGKDYEAGIGLRLGWLTDIWNCFTFGFTWQSRTYINHFKKYRGFIAENGNLSLPSIWGAGLTYYAFNDILISLDLERIMWTDTKMFRHDSRNPGRFGSQTGPGFGWDDQTVVKLGVAWTVNDCLALRIGYNYSDQVVDGADTVLNTLTGATVQNHFTVGLTWDVLCGEFSLSYIHGFADQVRGGNGPRSDEFIVNIRNDLEIVGLSYGRNF